MPRAALLPLIAVLALSLALAGCNARTVVPRDGEPAGARPPTSSSAAGSAGSGASMPAPIRAPVTGATVGVAPPAPSAGSAPCRTCASEPPGGAGGQGSAAVPDPDPPTQPTATATAGDSQCDLAGAFDPLAPQPGETCWSFAAHGASSTTDTTKFDVMTGESYSQFYFDVPWPAGSLATRFGANLDNPQVLRHAFAFASSGPAPSGSVMRNVTGTTLGENAELVAAWTLGGCNTSYPADVGGKLPDRGRIMVQWHHSNDTGRVQLDRSELVICTVPAGARPNVGGITLLGTENLGAPNGVRPGEQHFSGTCFNDSAAPITLVGLMPHMRTIGTHMRSVVNKVAGGSDPIFDQPFDPDQQVNYRLDPPYVMQPGDSVTSTCTYQNDTDRNVVFGASAQQEVCYQLALAYPYIALNNGASSLIAVTNTCW